MPEFDDIHTAFGYKAEAYGAETTKFTAEYTTSLYGQLDVDAISQAKWTQFRSTGDASFAISLQSSGVTKNIFSLSPYGLDLGNAAVQTAHRLKASSSLTAGATSDENIHGALFEETITTAYGLTVDGAVVSSALSYAPTASGSADFHTFYGDLTLASTGGHAGIFSSFRGNTDITATSGTFTDVRGAHFSTNFSGGANVTGYAGTYYDMAISAGTITSYWGTYVASPIISGTGAISTAYGIFVGNQAVSGVTTAYGVYVAGINTQSYFVGQVTAGSVVINGLGAGSGNSVIVEEGYELRRRTIDSAVWTGSYLSGFTTAHLTEGSNLYYTDARARAALAGTTNRITYTSGTGTIDISATYAGQTTITTLGTISAGIWQGSSINTTYTQAKVISVSPGTGISVNKTTGALTVTNSDRGSSQSIFKSIANSAGTVQFSAASNSDAIRFAASGDSSVSFDAGTKTVTISSSGGTTYSEGTGIDITGTAISIDTTWPGQAAITTVGTIGTGIWQGTAIADEYGGTGQSTYAAGDLLYASAANTLSKLSITFGGAFLRIVAGLPAWDSSVDTDDIDEGSNLYFTNARVHSAISGTTNRITVSSGVINISSSYAGQATINTLGNVTTGQWSATAIASTKGGTGLTSYSTGDILYASSTNLLSKLSIGSTGQVLKVSGGVPTWAAESGGVSNAFKFIDDEGGTTKITASGEDDFYVGDCGGITINWGAGGFIVDGSGLSDRKLKREVRNTLKNQCTNIIKSVPVKRFKWRNDVAGSPKFNRKFFKKNADQIGFIADELKAVVPDAVIYNKHFECEAIVEKDLVKILWGAVNELIGRIEALEQA